MPRRKLSTTKEQVRLRSKKIANGNLSLYLDYYQEGKRRYEFLRLYLIPKNSPNSKELNQNTLQAANAIKAQRLLEIVNGKAGIKNKQSLSVVKLTDWMRKCQEYLIGHGKSHKTAIPATLRLIEQYKPNLTLKEIDKSFCLRFLEYLRTTYRKSNGETLSKVTIVNYFNALNEALNMAVREEIIPENPFTHIHLDDRPTKPTSTRTFLTVDEVKTLIETPCESQDVKSAFMFSCFCGMRISDVGALKWEDIEHNGDITACRFIIKKTKSPIYLPLSPEAVFWMPERPKQAMSTDLVFRIPATSTVSYFLKRWANSAGITKPVTFHVARHTFATMMITANVDLYTISKLLGHSNIRVTEIYAKVVDLHKQQAVTRLSSLF